MKLLFIFLYLIVLIGVPLFELLVKSSIKRKDLRLPYKIKDKNIKIHYLKNYGMMFGTMKNKRKFIIISTCAVLLFIFITSGYIFLCYEKAYILKIGFMFLSGGSYSNALERLNFGYVIDYFSFPKCIFKKGRNIVYNMADVCIFISYPIIVLGVLFL